MNQVTIIGIIASICSGISLLPQLFKIFKEKKTENVSFGMLAVLFVGVILWIYYGYQKDDWIIMISNAFSWIVNVAILILYFKYKKKENE